MLFWTKTTFNRKIINVFCRYLFVKVKNSVERGSLLSQNLQSCSFGVSEIIHGDNEFHSADTLGIKERENRVRLVAQRVLIGKHRFSSRLRKLRHYGRDFGGTESVKRVRGQLE